MESRRMYAIVLLVAYTIILPLSLVQAVEAKAGDILFGSPVRSDAGGYTEGVFRVDALSSSSSVATFHVDTCGQGFLKDIAFGLNGEIFLLLDCNSLLPDVAQLDPASGTLISPPILDSDLLFGTVALLPDRDGSLLILCNSGCTVQQGMLRGTVLRVNPTSHAVTTVVNPYQLGSYTLLQSFIPTGLAMDQQGHLFIAGYHGSTAPGSAVIVKVDPANSTAETFAALEDLEQISDVAIDKAGYIYVAGTLPPSSDGTVYIPEKGAVIKISPQNSGEQTVFTNFQADPIPWSSANKLTIDLNGDLLMTSYQGIIRLTPTGGETLIYDPSPNDVSGAFLPHAIAALPGSISPPPPLATLALIDPVPQLLNGPQITPAATAADALPGQPYLADLTKGREVEGLATDGVAQVVIRIPAQSVGEQFALIVREDQCAALTPSGCIDEYGLVFDPTTPPSDIFGNQPNLNPNVTAVDTADGPMAFAAYRAPVDFVRSGASNASDKIAAQRSVFISINNSTQPDLEIKLVRPPVVFLHGLNADASVWDGFLPFINKTNLYSINIVNYGKLLVRPKIVRTVDGIQVEYDYSVIGKITPEPSSSLKDRLIRMSIRQSSLGFYSNAVYIFDRIQNLLGQGNVVGSLFRDGINPASVPVVASQVDIVAHSMGGNVTRTLPNVPGYFNDFSYGRGLVHKLITIGTPHLGSQQAIQILDPANTCLRENVAKLFRGDGADILSIEVFSGSVLGTVTGGTGDLRGNGLGKTLAQSPNSPAIIAQSDIIPLAMVAGDMGTQVVDLRNSLAAIGATAACFSTPLGSKYNPFQYSSIFDPYLGTGISSSSPNARYRSDAIVPLSSALNSASGLAESERYQTSSRTTFDQLEMIDGGKIFQNVVHGMGTLSLGFNGPYLLQEETGIPSHVEELINTSVTNAVYKRNYKRF